MILNKLRATNILKYARLELTELPEKGQIAVSGPNESGKTAIVETICFALFGRTFSHGPEDIVKIIRWGESSCEVELEFTANDKKKYQIKRSLDHEGVHAAQLHRHGEPIATGPQTVHDTIVDLCRFDYPQYLDALYLAQMEISAPHSQSDTIKEIAGASELEATAQDLREEIAEHQQQIGAIEQEIKELQLQLNALDVGEQVLARIEGEKSALKEQIEHNRSEITGLETAIGDLQAAGAQLLDAGRQLASADLNTTLDKWREYAMRLTDSVSSVKTACESLETDNELCAGGKFTHWVSDFEDRLAAFEPVREHTDEYQQQLAALLGEPSRVALDHPSLLRQRAALNRRVFGARSKRTLASIAFYIVALLALGAWAGWWLMKPAAEAAYVGMVPDWLQHRVAWWNPDYLSWSQPAAMGLTALAALLFMWPMRAESRLRGLGSAIAHVDAQITHVRAQLATLETLGEKSLPAAMAALRELDQEAITQAAEAFQSGAGDVFHGEEALGDYQAELSDALQHAEADVSALREGIASRIGALNQSTEDAQHRLALCDEEVSAYEARKGDALTLEQEIEAQHAKITAHRDAIKLRQLAVKLTEDTCRNIYKRFNGVLIKYTGEVMPRLTEGRYSQVQIDDDLNVKVFSRDKNDFGELDEFSSGSQRQMLLAVRLAMAKALVEATEQHKQFIILDEPFAFFDRERIKHTLKALPEVDKRMNQIWIITQEFDQDHAFKLHVACSRDSDELRVGECANTRIFNAEHAKTQGSQRDLE